jgi:outer membrane protein
MYTIKRISLLFALLGLTVSSVSADELLSFKAGYQQLSPDGDFAVSGGSLTGTTVDMDDDLGFDDSEEYTLEAALQLGSFRLFAGYLPINFSGEGVLTETVDFNGETFVAGSHVDSDVDIDIYEAGLAWYLVNVDDLPVRVQLGPELAVKYVDASVEMRNSTGLNESESVKAPVPTVGLRGRVAIADFLGVVGRAGYMEYQDNSFFDVDAQVEFSPLPLVGLFAGYRYLDVDIDEDDVLIDASFKGPYAGALIRF